MNIEKISTQKVSDAVVEQIEKLIGSGTFKAGEKLPSVRELCDMFDVGRSAVRDAITTLKGRGTVYVKHGEGTFICEFDPAKLFNTNMLAPNSEDISELYQVRKLLETGIAEMAALHRTEDDVRIMEENLRAQASGGDGWASDYQFHLAIAKASGNQILIELMQFISSTTKKAMNDFHQSIANDEEMVQTIADQHQQIFASIKAGEASKAHQRMAEHLNFVEDHLKSRVLRLTSQS